MSSPLLEKLAPETRAEIYGYLLTFESPLRHVDNMRPFIKKLVTTGDDEPHAKTRRPEAEPVPGSQRDEAETSLHRVETAILTASKLVYVEAIAVFYKMNTVKFNAPLYKLGPITSPRATDLSLVTQLVTEIDKSWVGSFKTGVDTASLSAVSTTLNAIVAIFPNLRACTVYMYTDEAKSPTKFLFELADLLRKDESNGCHFDGVGSVVASMNSNVKLVVQYKALVDRWAHDALTPRPSNTAPISGLTANELMRSIDTNTALQQVFTQMAFMFLRSFRSFLVTPAYPVFTLHSHEFWTCMEESLHSAKALFG